MKNSVRQRKFEFPTINLTLFKGRVYKVVNRGTEVFGTLMKQISDRKILLYGFDGRNRIIKLFRDSQVFRLDKTKKNNKKK